MYIDKNFFNTIKPVLLKLRKEINDEFIIFGSTPLYLLGILEFKKNKFNDLDIMVKNKSSIPPEAKEVTFQKNQNQKLYKLIIDNIKIDIGSLWPGQKKYFYKFFKDPIIIDNLKFANLNIIKEWKEMMIKKYSRQKDKNHLKKIKKYIILSKNQ